MRPLHSIFAICLALVACGSPEHESPCDEVTCSQHGTCIDTQGVAGCICDTGYVVAGLECVEPTSEPAILRLSAKEPVISPDGPASFLLVVNGPADEDDPVDAILETIHGQPVAQFVPGALPRTYRADVTWAQMNALDPLTFLVPEARLLVARVWDDTGWEETDTVEISPTCPGDSGACRGKCDTRMVTHQSVALTEDDCEDWQCGDQTPINCLAQPTAWLWMAKDEYGKLLDDVHADVEVDGLFYFMGQCGEVGVEIHGGLARKFDKKSFKVKFNRSGWFPFDPFATVPVSEPTGKGFKQFIFKAHWVDASLMRDHLTHDLARELGGLAPRVTHTNLILNGKYHGIYGLTESILNDYVTRLDLPGQGGLYKAVNHNANFKAKSDPMAGYEKKMGSDDDLTDIEGLLDAIATAPLTDDGFASQVGDTLDLDLYLAYSVANAYANNQDAFTKNYYLYAEPGEPFVTINWDADATFGISWDGTDEPTDSGGLWGKLNSLSGKLSKISEYDETNAAIFADGLDDGPMSPESLHQRVNDIAEAMAPDVRFEECRWDKDTSFVDQLDVIHQFVDDRANVVDSWLQ